MTINEKRQLSNYIKGLVRESLGEMDDMPRWYNEKNHGFGDEEEYDDFKSGFENDEIDGEFDDSPVEGDGNDFWEEYGHEQPGRHYEGPDVNPEADKEDEPAGLDELRRLAESYARQSVAQILSESKKKKKRKNKKEKSSSKDKTVISQLNADGTNAAHYYYKLYGVENGTDAEKAAARSKGYKKAKGKKNDTGVPYKFTSKERNRLNSLLTDKK